MVLQTTMFKSWKYNLKSTSSSILVFILSIFTLYSGYRFIKNHKDQNSRKWWGYTLILTGFGSVLAGISYQLLGYELKCAEKEYCNWTNWFEIFYNLFTVTGAGALLIAGGYSCFKKTWINFIKKIALIKVIIYFIFCIIGTIIPNKFLISYEFLVIFSIPIYIILFFINFYQYLLLKNIILKYYIKLWLFQLFKIWINRIFLELQYLVFGK